MKFKTTYILFGILVVVIGLFAYALWHDTTGRSKNDTKYVLPVPRNTDGTVKTGDVTKVEIERNQPKAENIVFERDGDTERWTITSPRKLRADSIAVNALIQQLVNATREDKVDQAPSLAAWGLDPAQAIMSLTMSGKDYKLHIGNPNSTGDLYVLDPYDPKNPMVVKQNRLSDTLKTLGDFRDGDLLAVTPTNVQAVALSKGKETVALKKFDRARWAYTEPKDYGDADAAPEAGPAGTAKTTPRSVATVLTDLAGLKVEKSAQGTDFVEDGVSKFDKYLDKEPLRIQITRLDETTNAEGKPVSKSVDATLVIGKKTDDKTEKYYAWLDGDNNVVKVDARFVDPLLALLDSKGALRDRRLVAMDTPPTAANIKNVFGLVQLRRTKAVPIAPELERQMPGAPGPDTWILWRDDNTPQTVDLAMVQGPLALVNLIRQRTPPLIERFIEKRSDRAKQESELGFDKPQAVVELWDEEDGIVKEDATEPLKAAEKRKMPKLNSKEPTYRLTFGDVSASADMREMVNVKRETRRKDGSYDAIFVEVPRTLLDEAKKGPLAYMPKNLERFTDSGLPGWKGVTKVEFERDGKTIEVTREKDEAPWKIVKPADLAGRVADTQKIEMLLRGMNMLMALQLTKEKPTPEQLDKDFGLKTPKAQVKITIVKDDKPVTYTYDFGKEDEGTIFARQSQRDIVVKLPKIVLDLLPPDVLDPVVLRLNPADVEKLKITGWSGITWELERKDGKWMATKPPPEHKLEPAKVEQFLKSLQELRAVKYLRFKSEPKADEGFDIPKKGMKIEITLKGKKEPITLSVGRVADGGGYYAMSSETDGDVFLLPNSVFDGPKEAPAYFSP